MTRKKNLIFKLLLQILINDFNIISRTSDFSIPIAHAAYRIKAQSFAA